MCLRVRSPGLPALQYSFPENGVPGSKKEQCRDGAQQFCDTCGGQWRVSCFGAGILRSRPDFGAKAGFCSRPHTYLALPARVQENAEKALFFAGFLTQFCDCAVGEWRVCCFLAGFRREGRFFPPTTNLPCFAQKTCKKACFSRVFSRCFSSIEVTPLPPRRGGGFLPPRHLRTSGKRKVPRHNDKKRRANCVIFAHSATGFCIQKRTSAG